MNQLAEVLAFFAAPPAKQVEALPSLPVDPGARDFHADFGRNPLLVLVQTYLRFFFHRDDEPWEAFLERLGVPPSTGSWPESVAELNYVLDTISPRDPAMWTQRALDRKVAWRLARRLARVALADFGWSTRADRGNLEALLKQYSPQLATEWREEGWTWRSE